VTLRFDTPWLPNANYQFLIDPSFTDCSGLNQLAGPTDEAGRIIVSLQYDVRRLSISHSGSSLHITWDDPTAVLYEADSVDAGPGLWSSAGTGGSVTVSATGRRKFYTLRR